jgi:predicted DNA-binding transcriptional regulator YafY
MKSLRQMQRTHQLLLRNPSGISYRRVCRDLGVSRATAYRIFGRLRGEWGAPIVRAKRAGLFRYESGKFFDLPGCWLSEGELGILLGLIHWITRSETRFLDGQVGSVRARLESLAAKLRRTQTRKDLENPPLFP